MSRTTKRLKMAHGNSFGTVCRKPPGNSAVSSIFAAHFSASLRELPTFHLSCAWPDETHKHHSGKCKLQIGGEIVASESCSNSGHNCRCKTATHSSRWRYTSSISANCSAPAIEGTAITLFRISRPNGPVQH